eukprot:3254028-Lingulodinium_polyedra.AAC.1
MAERSRVCTTLDDPGATGGTGETQGERREQGGPFAGRSSGGPEEGRGAEPGGPFAVAGRRCAGARRR